MPKRSLTPRASYDAWGKQTITKKAPFPFYRGYTGHEHLPEFGLINMNGRMYDPVVARFLSPAPYVQAPDLSQNFNRYSYCLNNPLIYTDPSGEIAWLIPIAIGAVMNAQMQGMAGNINSAGDFFKSLGVGALAGAAGYGAGALISSGITSVGAIGGAVNGALGGFASGFTGVAGNAWVSGASFRSGLGLGLAGGGFGGLTGGMLGGISGAEIAYRHGGNVLTGDGSTFISEIQESLIGVVTADKSAITTNQQVMDLLNQKNINISDFNVSAIDIEGIDVSARKSVYFREKGIIYRVNRDDGSGGYAVGGITTYTIKNLKPTPSKIFMSTHNTIPNFMKSLNHELIHAWQFAKFGYTNLSEWSVFMEASAYRYTNTFFPSMTPPAYSGPWVNRLTDWPSLPSVY